MVQAKNLRTQKLVKNFSKSVIDNLRTCSPNYIS